MPLGGHRKGRDGVPPIGQSGTDFHAHLLAVPGRGTTLRHHRLGRVITQQCRVALDVARERGVRAQITQPHQPFRAARDQHGEIESANLW